MHQWFQKLTIADLPATSARVTRPPARFGRSNAGAALPTRRLCLASACGSLPTLSASTTANTTTTCATASAAIRAGCFTPAPLLLLLRRGNRTPRHAERRVRRVASARGRRRGSTVVDGGGAATGPGWCRGP